MKRTLTLTMGLIATVALVGCGRYNPANSDAAQDARATRAATSLEERLIGAWEMKGSVGAPPRIAFQKGGRVDVTAPVSDGTLLTISGTYDLVGSRLTMRATVTKEMDLSLARPILERFDTYTCSVEDTALTLTDPDGAVTAWKKL
jgi:hypothetical protein